MRRALVLLLAVALAAGCSVRKKRKLEAELATLSSEQLYERGLTHLAGRDLDIARKIFERIEFTSDPAGRPKLEPLVRLSLADTTFYTSNDLSLIDARTLYLDFVTLYGSHPFAPYAQLQAGLCSLRQVYAASRDQTQTRQAIDDLKVVLQRWPDGDYANAARDLLQRAQRRLAEHDYQVGRFYMTKKRYAAAAERFRGVLQNYPEAAEREKVLYHLGEAHVLNKNSAEGALYLDQLVSEYPDGEYADPARRLLARIATQDAAATNGNGP